jgi:hypothetical protein
VHWHHIRRRTCVVPAHPLTLHFLLLHDSQAIDTRALDGAAGPAAEAELTVDGKIWRGLLGSAIANADCSLIWKG